MKVKPTPVSFLPKYISSCTPLILTVVYIATKTMHLNFSVLILSSIPLILTVAWVLRNKEAVTSLGLTLLFTTILIFLNLSSNLSLTSLPYITKKLIEDFPKYIVTPSIFSSFLTLLWTEMFRRSITYRIEDDGIILSGGVFRRQEHVIPYDKIGRVVLEQGVLGRLLGYGTIIPVGIASWGEEYYTRALGGGVAGNGLAGGVGYARTVQEISREPLKVLYGVPNPHYIYNVLRERVSFMYRAKQKELGLLQDIKNELALSKRGNV